MRLTKEGEKLWSYNYSIPSDELYHHGIKGMKWGVRKDSSGGRSGGGPSKIKKFAKNRVEKRKEKRKAKDEKIQKTVDRFGAAGVAGTAVKNYLGYSRSHALRGTLANVINMSANTYIATGGSNYRVARGVDFVRRASISALSIKDTAEKINAFANVGKAAIYANEKKRNK